MGEKVAFGRFCYLSTIYTVATVPVLEWAEAVIGYAKRASVVAIGSRCPKKSKGGFMLQPTG